MLQPRREPWHLPTSREKRVLSGKVTTPSPSSPPPKVEEDTSVSAQSGDQPSHELTSKERRRLALLARQQRLSPGKMQVFLNGFPAREVTSESEEILLATQCHQVFELKTEGNEHYISIRLPTLPVADVPNPGYHLSPIPKGVYGEASKVVEEALEFKDALEQGCEVMGLIELCDLVGAIKGYLKAHVGFSLQDLEKMSDITERAFRNGHRG